MRSFSERFEESSDPVALLYGADADGFAAGYFIWLVLQNGRRSSQSRAVWNFDYGFEWLPGFLTTSPAGLLVCVDVPIQRQREILTEASRERQVAIYDHHREDSADREIPVPNVTYLNSRLLGGEESNHPASAFAAAFAASVLGELTREDLIVLLVGLIGDRAEVRHRQLVADLENAFPILLEHERSARKYVQLIDAMFRARIGTSPQGLYPELSASLHGGNTGDPLAPFVVKQNLRDAKREVDREVERAVSELSRLATDASGLLYAVLPWMQTFSVGPAASRLARGGIARAVCLGFQVGDRIEYELRTADDAVDLTEVLREQRALFSPISAGGHPNAAGVQIRSEDKQDFANSLRQAWARVTDDSP